LRRREKSAFGGNLVDYFILTAIAGYLATPRRWWFRDWTAFAAGCLFDRSSVLNRARIGAGQNKSLPTRLNAFVKHDVKKNRFKKNVYSFCFGFFPQYHRVHITSARPGLCPKAAPIRTSSEHEFHCSNAVLERDYCTTPYVKRLLYRRYRRTRTMRHNTTHGKTCGVGRENEKKRGRGIYCWTLVY